MNPVSFQQLANFIWSVADLLRGPYRPPQYERVMLPLTVLRRFDAVLAPTKKAVLERYEALRAKNSPPSTPYSTIWPRTMRAGRWALITIVNSTSTHSRATPTTSAVI